MYKMSTFKKLSKIIYPIDFPGKSIFKNKKEAILVIKKYEHYLNQNGSFTISYPQCDPNCQQLVAAINYYLFGIDHNESDGVKRLKINYAYHQNKMFINDDDKLSLKGICRMVIRKDAALKLDLIRRDNIFKPLLVITRRGVFWNPELKLLLENMTSSLPRTLQTFVQLPNLGCRCWKERYQHLGFWSSSRV